MIVQDDRAEEQERGDDAQADQGRHRFARQHPVIDLEHEDRAGEHQDVADGGKDADADQGVAAGAHGVREFRLRR